MHTATISTALIGPRNAALPANVGVQIGPGSLPSFDLNWEASRELRDRLRAAMMASDFNWPTGRINVLTDLGICSTQAGGLDLPTALALLIASGQTNIDPDLDFAAMGELGLDGSLRPVRSCVSLADQMTSSAGLLVVPMGNFEAVVGSLGAGTLVEVIGSPDLNAAIEELERRVA